MLIIALMKPFINSPPSLDEAQAVLDTDRMKGRALGSSMVTANAKSGHMKEALELFKQMELAGVQPDKRAFVSIMNACDNVNEARTILDRNGKGMKLRAMWTSMIAKYAKSGHVKEALEILRRMKSVGVHLNKRTFLIVINACSTLASFEDGKSIHEIINVGEFESDIVVRTALVNMYGKCGSPAGARSIFDQTRKRDLVLWTTMIGAYARNGCSREALELFFYQINSHEALMPDKIAFVIALDACASLAWLEKGRMIHGMIRATGCDMDVALDTALLNMYGKCGSLGDAWAIFDAMHMRDIIAWTAMISAYARNGHGKEALQLFRRMQLDGVWPDRVTFLCVLDACAGGGGSPESLENGRSIHEQIVASGFESDPTLKTALVNMYGKCGSVADAQTVFNGMQCWNVVSWSAMIATYAQNGHCKEAVELFQQMGLEGLKPDKIAFLNILEACTTLASLEIGKEIHKHINANQHCSDTCVKNALLNMYGKCGSLEHAQGVFDEMQHRDTITWNSIIATYARNGLNKEALELFRQMNSEGVHPNQVTFVNSLNACSHSCLLDEGWQIFMHMHRHHSITPSPEHYICLIDLLGRGGRLKEAEDLARNMPINLDLIARTSLLGACST